MKSAVGRHPFALAATAAGVTGAVAFWLHWRSVRKLRQPVHQTQTPTENRFWRRIVRLPVEIIISALMQRLTAGSPDEASVDPRPTGGD